MSVSTVEHAHAVRTAHAVAQPSGLAALTVPVARALFAAIFLSSAPGHFSAGTIAYAASAGVPLAGIAVPLSGVIAALGGLGILLGYHARIGGALIALFLVPVTLSLHAFWAVPDPQAAHLQYLMFMKNAGLLGGALLVTYFGAGPLSLDALRAARSSRGGK